ncbi:acetamidase/formamidase family protein [Arenibaculum pallidiluteum]|uniref:acetamidase/formamidase family protein n=1 Tax=Arenibaculum pallidiluteum TaxID=2812559 RepID=UPI001A965516|nr:acetamidase/formamidase family protein [Arenibaculum pallidiluteum]
MTHHTVTARPENVFWGFFDARTEPVLQVDSGDLVTFNTLPGGSADDLPADMSLVLPDHLAALEALAPSKGPGPHLMTGPVHVRGAVPGDVLQVDILDVRPRQRWGYCSILPLLGTLPEEFTDYERIHIEVDVERWVGVLPWGKELPLDPFFGIMAVAPPPQWGRVGSAEPRAFGGNMDNKDLRAGTTVYFPVFNEGALFSCGDGHGCQGDGEVCITALETALDGTFRLTVRKDMPAISQPFAETGEHLISMGFHEDLDDAARQAVREMVRLVTERTELTRNHAYMLCSLAGDLKATQLVDGNKGIHMVLPKSAL